MPLWIKALLWTAVVLLPGGIFLAPVLLGLHRRERRIRLRGGGTSERTSRA